MIKSCRNAIKETINNHSKKKKNSLVLDIGCGKGEYTNYFNKNGNFIIGVDIKDIIKDNYKNSIKLCISDGTELPFKDNTFGIVISFDTIEHIEADVLFLNEIYRVLNKGGEIFLGTPNRLRLSRRLLKFIGKEIRYPVELGNDKNLGRLIHIREYNSYDITKLIKRAGFHNIKVIPTWLGLRFKFLDLGLSKFPEKFNPLVQYWFIIANK